MSLVLAETPVRLTATPPATAKTLRPEYWIAEDSIGGIIRMMVKGFFDIPTLARHFDENRVMVDRWRSDARPIRVYIDAVDLKPHSPEGQALVQQSTASIYLPGDRVAVCVESSLVRMQMRRALRQGDVIDFFTTEFSALHWLNATN